MTFSYDNLRQRYPRFKWHYSVEVGFWCEMPHVLYSAEPRLYAHFRADTYPDEIDRALRELDIIHDAIARPEYQDLEVDPRFFVLRMRPPR